MSVPVQPPIGINTKDLSKAASKHATSSSAPPRPLSESSWVQVPPSPSTALQYSKCPISSEKATLYECAAHGTRVCSLEVAYMGWKSYGRLEQVLSFGAKMICWKPLSRLDVLEPEPSRLRSLRLTRRPASLSRRSTVITSPGSMNSVRPRRGVK